MEKLHSIFPLSARPRRLVATCSCPPYLQSGKAACCDAGSSSPRCGFGVLPPARPWAPLPVCAGRARSWQSPTSHTAQLLGMGRACQDRRAGQAQAVPGSAPRISHIYPAPIPTPCTTCIHSTPHIACIHLNLPSTHDSTFTLLPSLHHLCSPCTHPCSPHCPIPASPVFSLLVLTQAPQHRSCRSICQTAHLPPLLLPLLPLHFAPLYPNLPPMLCCCPVIAPSRAGQPCRASSCAPLGHPTAQGHPRHCRPWVAHGAQCGDVWSTQPGQAAPQAAGSCPSSG